VKFIEFNLDWSTTATRTTAQNWCKSNGSRRFVEQWNKQGSGNLAGSVWYHLQDCKSCGFWSRLFLPCFVVFLLRKLDWER